MASRVLLFLLWSSYVLFHGISKHINKQFASCRWKKGRWAASIHRFHDPILNNRHIVTQVGKAHCSEVWGTEAHREERNNKRLYFTTASGNYPGCSNRYACIRQKSSHIPGVTTVKAPGFLYRRVLLGCFCSHWSSISWFHVESFLPRQYWNSYSFYHPPILICFLGSMDLDSLWCSLRSHPHSWKIINQFPPLLSLPEFTIY